MTWWCSATGELWSWSWRAYPGVWLMVGLLFSWYWRARRRAGNAGISPWFIAGLLCLWAALDWPIGALGAGYLVSVHTVSYILLALVAPPCLILGIPEPLKLAAFTSRRWGALVRLANRPWFALAAFNAALFLTHVPQVVDTLMGSQVGAFLVDLAWLLGGLALWWPIMATPPGGTPMRRPLKMAYLFASTLPPIIPSAFLTFAEYPLYATYELAPRVYPILTAQQDQQVGGLLMKLVGDLPVWFAFGVIFFRWARDSTVTAPPVHPASLVRSEK